MGNDSSAGFQNSTLPRDMHRPSSSQAQGSSRSVNTHDAALFAQIAATTMSTQVSQMPYESLLTQGAYRAPDFNDHLYPQAMGHTQLPPFSSLDFPWHLFPPHHQGPQHPDHFPMSPGTSYPFVGASSTSQTSGPVGSPVASHQSRRTSNSTASTSAPISSDPDPPQTDDNEPPAIAEEKRRRNTAASARFRIKKKQRTTNLERSVNDLTGRAEDLEREAADLRRENGWLKEIVMLKGTRLAGQNLASHIMAESAEAQRSSGGVSDEDEDGPEADNVLKKRGKSRKK